MKYNPSEINSYFIKSRRYHINSSLGSCAFGGDFVLARFVFHGTAQRPTQQETRIRLRTMLTLCALFHRHSRWFCSHNQSTFSCSNLAWSWNLIQQSKMKYISRENPVNYCVQCFPFFKFSVSFLTFRWSRTVWLAQRRLCVEFHSTSGVQKEFELFFLSIFLPRSPFCLTIHFNACSCNFFVSSRISLVLSLFISTLLLTKLQYHSHILCCSPISHSS